MRAKFTDFPIELVIRVLFNADLLSVLRSRQVGKVLNGIITESSLLQYKIELAINGMIDGPGIIDGEETASSRLEALRAYRNAWETLTPRKKMTIPGRSNDTSHYELCGSVWARAGKTAGDPVNAHKPNTPDKSRRKGKYRLVRR